MRQHQLCISLYPSSWTWSVDTQPARSCFTVQMVLKVCTYTHHSALEFLWTLLLLPVACYFSNASQLQFIRWERVKSKEIYDSHMQGWATSGFFFFCGGGGGGGKYCIFFSKSCQISSLQFFFFLSLCPSMRMVYWFKNFIEKEVGME